MAGHLYVVSGPSGSGKTSLAKALINSMPGLFLSTSYTTRAPRATEIEGKSYYFVEDTVFSKMQEQGEFIESAQVFQYWYGTGKTKVQEQLELGQDVLLEIDWQGAKQVKELFPEASLIFIVPHSPAILLARLQKRCEDTEAVIAERIEAAKKEVAQYSTFDFLVINDVFEDALTDLAHIVQSERLKVRESSLRQNKCVQAFLK